MGSPRPQGRGLFLEFSASSTRIFDQGPNGWESAQHRIVALQRVGMRINEQHGYEGMVNVCDTVRAAGNAGGATELEGIWDGIGEWRR